MLNFSNPVENHPYPHIVQDNILPNDLYNSLKETLPCIDSFGQAFRMHGDLTYGDQIYDELLNFHPAWKNLHDYIYSEQFLNLIINKFRPNIISSIESGELNLDLQNLKYDSFMEGRKIKKNVKQFPLLDKFVSKPSDLYTRLDIGYGLESYGKIGGEEEYI